MKYLLLIVGLFICLPSHGQVFSPRFPNQIVIPQSRLGNRIIIPNEYALADIARDKKDKSKWEDLIKSRGGDSEEFQMILFNEWQDASKPKLDQEISARSYGRLTDMTKWAQGGIHLAPNHVFEFNRLVKEALKDNEVTWWEYYNINISEDKYRSAKKKAEKKEEVRKYKAKILSNIGAE
jgi:hypothetical protein